MPNCELKWEMSDYIQYTGCTGRAVHELSTKTTGSLTKRAPRPNVMYVLFLA